MGKIRKTDSKEKIEKAFIRLLADKSFDQISISSIAKAAGINRGTFYLNYINKDDLLNTLLDRLFTEMRVILLADVSPKDTYFSDEAIRKIAIYLKANYSFVYALLTTNLNISINKRFMALLQYSFKSKNASHTAGVPAAYAREAVFSSIIAIFSLWIRRGTKESIPEIITIVRKYSELSPQQILSN